MQIEIKSPFNMYLRNIKVALQNGDNFKITSAADCEFVTSKLQEATINIKVIERDRDDKIGRPCWVDKGTFTAKKPIFSYQSKQINLFEEVRKYLLQKREDFSKKEEQYTKERSWRNPNEKTILLPNNEFFRSKRSIESANGAKLFVVIKGKETFATFHFKETYILFPSESLTRLYLSHSGYRGATSFYDEINYEEIREQPHVFVAGDASDYYNNMNGYRTYSIGACAERWANVEYVDDY